MHSLIRKKHIGRYERIITGKREVMRSSIRKKHIERYELIITTKQIFELRPLHNIKVKKEGHYITIEIISHSMQRSISHLTWIHILSAFGKDGY